MELEGGVEIWCGDCNTHSTIWRDQEYSNGDIVEKMMGEKDLVCLNDGSGTTVNLVRDADSAIALM